MNLERLRRLLEQKKDLKFRIKDDDKLSELTGFLSSLGYTCMAAYGGNEKKASSGYNFLYIRHSYGGKSLAFAYLSETSFNFDRWATEFDLENDNK